MELKKVLIKESAYDNISNEQLAGMFMASLIIPDQEMTFLASIGKDYMEPIKREFPKSQYIKMEIPVVDIFPYNADTFSKLIPKWFSDILFLFKFVIIAQSSDGRSIVAQAFNEANYFIGFVTYINAIEVLPHDMIIFTKDDNSLSSREISLPHIHISPKLSENDIVCKNPITIIKDNNELLVTHRSHKKKGYMTREELSLVMTSMFNVTGNYKLIKTDQEKYIFEKM